MAIRLPSAWKDELLARTDIVSVVSSYVSLKKDGRRYWGLCPFHNEKTPSFSVNPDMNMYYCFGCKATGDAIRFVMEMERAPFMDAVKLLADRAHMPLPELQEDPGKDCSPPTGTRRAITTTPFGSRRDRPCWIISTGAG